MMYVNLISTQRGALYVAKCFALLRWLNLSLDMPPLFGDGGSVPFLDIVLLLLDVHLLTCILGKSNIEVFLFLRMELQIDRFHIIRRLY